MISSSIKNSSHIGHKTYVKITNWGKLFGLIVYPCRDVVSIWEWRAFIIFLQIKSCLYMSIITLFMEGGDFEGEIQNHFYMILNISRNIWVTLLLAWLIIYITSSTYAYPEMSWTHFCVESVDNLKKYIKYPKTLLLARYLLFIFIG